MADGEGRRIGDKTIRESGRIRRILTVITGRGFGGTGGDVPGKGGLGLCPGGERALIPAFAAGEIPLLVNVEEAAGSAVGHSANLAATVPTHGSMSVGVS